MAHAAIGPKRQKTAEGLRRTGEEANEARAVRMGHTGLRFAVKSKARRVTISWKLDEAKQVPYTINKKRGRKRLTQPYRKSLSKGITFFCEGVIEKSGLGSGDKASA